MKTAEKKKAGQTNSRTADLLQQLLQFQTFNPPGHTIKEAEFLKSLFKKAGTETEIIQTPKDGVAHFIARVKGNGNKQPVLLAAHSDVVPVDRSGWSVDPFAGVIQDGYVLGRGAMDFKGGQAVFVSAILKLIEEKVPLDRDVIFLAECDEEAGDYGTEWLAKNHWDKINAEFALNEGGWIFIDENGEAKQVNITTRDKIYVSLKLTASGHATHSSRPMFHSAIGRLGKALAKIAAWDTEPTLIPQTREYFRTLAETAKGALADNLRTLADSTDPKTIRRAGQKVVELGEYPYLWHALMRNTVASTMLDAGIKENVIPGQAEAIVNVRLIPGSMPFTVMEQIRNLINDPKVKVELAHMTEKEGREYYSVKTRVKPSPIDTELFKALEQCSQEVWPKAKVVPALFEAGTDATAWRTRGVPVYGIYPYPLNQETLSRMHGNDERILIQSLEEGTEMIYKTLAKVAGSK